VHAFSSFVYLDLQKTGSTFVNEFLRLHVRERAIEFRQHKPVTEYDPGKFYFITCRDPLQQYLSLYSFGCAGRGRFRKRLGPQMYDRTAAGFSEWLRFTLGDHDADSSGELKAYGESGIASFVGFQTFRLLSLSFVPAGEVFSSCHSIADIREAFRTKRIWNEALRNEELSSALASLVRRVLADYLTDVDAALEYLAANKKLEISERVDEAEDFTIADADKRLIEEREWLFFEELGYPRYTKAGAARPAQDALG
jgi:hypothetical protein